MPSKKDNTLASVISDLSAPWRDEQLKFRIQGMDKNNRPPQWAQVAAYVDARDVEERFNEVCAKYDGEWHNDVEIIRRTPVGDKGEYEVVAKATVSLDIAGHVFRHADYGIGGDEKAAASDALKRAAVLFGMDGAYRGHDIWLGKGEFDERGRIFVSDEELLERFKTGKRPSRGSGQQTQQSAGQQRRGCKDPNAPASQKAMGYAHSLMKKAGVTNKEHRAILASLITGGENVNIENMTCQQASDIIEALNGEDAKLWLDKLQEVISDGAPDEEFPPEEELPF